MSLKICEYCGTEYDQSLPSCPLCGHGLDENEDVRTKSRGSGKRGGARVAPKKTKKPRKQREQDRIPQWMWAVICVILGLAVLIGLAYFLISMGYIGGKEAKPQEPQISVTAPAVEPDIEPAVAEPVPEEPVDLSCQELTLSETGIILDVAGSSIFLTAVPTPLDCTDPIIFSSADETIATVDEIGMITAVSRGQTEILVQCGDVVESCVIICDFPEEETDPEEEQTAPEEEQTDPENETAAEPEEEEPEEVLQPELSSVDFTLFRPGEETTLSVKNAPEGAAITYVSSNPAVVSVSDTGKVKAVGNGMATITVTVGDTKLTCVARCNLGTTAENTGGETTTVTGTLSLSYTDVSLFSAGESFVLALRDSDGNKATGINWTTSNGGICAVDANGRVTAMGGGTATVQGSYNGQIYSCIVRCNF